MPKMKTNKSVAKRIKITARGKLMRHKAGTGHLKSRKTNKQLRRMRKAVPLAANFVATAKAMLGK